MEKNEGVRGLFLKKQKLCMQNLMKEMKQPRVVTSATGEFLQYTILYLLIRIIKRSDQGVQFMNFSSQILFNDINHGYRAAVLKKNLCGCFCFIWLWLLTAIMKRCPELCTLQFHCTSLTLCTTFLGRSGISNSQTGPENHYGYF